MDLSLPSRVQENTETAGLRISLEAICYVTLFAFALLMRLIDLGSVELNAYEAREALAALHRINPEMTSTPAIASNPLMAFVNQLMFFLIEPSAELARGATAVMGALMVLGPWLWREQLGPTAALSMSLLLAVSSVSLAASRTMGGVVWTMTLAFTLVWLVNRFNETRNPSLAITATVVGVLMAIMTEPTGLLTLLGIGCGVLFASLYGKDVPQHHPEEESLLQAWPWRDGLLAAIGVSLIVGTGFFTVPDGLTSTGTTIYRLAEGFVTRPDEIPAAFALLITARYDTGILIFGLIGLYFALTEDGYFARFLAGWLMFSLTMALLYQDAGPDAALWIIVPAAGLTALLIRRMLTDPSIGYWVVPSWGVPVHALATAALITAISINAVRIATVLTVEARPFGYHVLTANAQPDNAAKIGTFDETRQENTFEIMSVVDTIITIQLWRVDGAIDPELRIVRNIERIDPETGEIVVEEAEIVAPMAYVDERPGLIIEDFVLPANITYFIKVRQSPETLPARGQFIVLTHPQSAAESTSFINIRLDFPELWTVIRAMNNQSLAPLTLMITIFLIMLVIIAYFLAGSIWGSRAAWRGLGFGTLIFFVVSSFGLGWQASVSHAHDPTELWQTSPTTTASSRLVETLQQMARFENGMLNRLSITAMTESDSRVAWALRNFSSVEYVNGVGPETTTDAVLVPYDARDVVIGADYVGQDFILTEQWGTGDLAWLDLMSWLSVRRTRFQPVPGEHYMLWVRKDVYGVDEVISTQARQ